MLECVLYDQHLRAEPSGYWAPEDPRNWRGVRQASVLSLLCICARSIDIDLAHPRSVTSSPATRSVSFSRPRPPTDHAGTTPARVREMIGSTEPYALTVISARRGWFDWRLRQLWRCRDLISLFVGRDLITRYKQTILGPAW